MHRDNLSEEITDSLRRSIAWGRLEGGERINESALSAELEVSRTPLREALQRLSSEGFVTCEPRRGFFVQNLGAEEARHLYEIRAILDPAALRAAGPPSKEQVAELGALNVRIERCRDVPDGVIELDDAWHETLLRHCPNRILLGLVRQFMLRTRPLERAYVREAANRAAMVREHAAVIEAAERDDLEAAAVALERNLTSASHALDPGTGDQEP